MNKNLGKQLLILFSALALFCTNAKSQTENLFSQEARKVWDVLYSGSVHHLAQAMYVHNGIIHVAVWDLNVPENKIGKLERYMPNGNKLMEFAPIEIEMPDGINLGAQNFLGFTSDGTYIYGVNMSEYIYVIDPIQQKVVDYIQLKPSAGLVGITYDPGKDGFWATDINGVKIWFVDRDGLVYDGTFYDEISMGNENFYLVGLTYDDITEGGPYIWSSAGGEWENGIARIGRFHIPSGEYTSEIIDVKELLGFGNVIGANIGSIFMYQDYDQRKQILVGTLPGQYTLFGIDMGAISGKGSPRKAENFTITADDNAAFGATLSWTNPEKLIDGSDIDALTKITVSKEGTIVHTINNPAKGAQGAWRDTDFSEKGLYSYSIVASNSDGDGLPANKSVFIGEDTPGSVRNIKVIAQNTTTCKISWNAPTTGKYEGWFNESQLSYKVVRMPDQKVILNNTIQQSVIDNTISEKDIYSYMITSYTNAGEGSSVTSPNITLGDFFTVPWSDDFSNRESFFELWTLINGNNDDKNWSHHPGYFDSDAKIISTGYEGSSDDWMITPALRLESGKEYRLRWDSYANADDGVAYYVTIGSDKTVDAQNKILSTIFPTSDYTSHQENQKFTVETDGDYYIGFHSVAKAIDNFSYTVEISQFSIIDLPDYDLGANSISGNTEVMAGEVNEFKATILNEGRYNISDPFNVELWYLNEEETKVSLGTQTYSVGLPVNTSTDIAFNVTFAKAGLYKLYAEVSCVSDMDNKNNISSVYLVEVNPLGTIKIQIGETGGINTSNVLPFNTYYPKSSSQSIYLADEIGTTGVINKLQYHYSFQHNEAIKDKPLQIYITTTELSDVSLEWIMKDTILVFDGLVNIPGGRGSLIIPLDNPYLYNGGNLAVTHVSNGVVTSNPLNQFYYTMTDRYGASRIMASNQENIDFTQIGRLVEYIPVTTFILNERGASLSGTIKNTNNDPISKAVVQIEGTNWIAMTDDNGSYSYPFIPANDDPYTIKVTKTGYADNIQATSIETINKTVDFVLSSLSTITVSGTIKNESNIALDNANVILSGNDNYQVLTNNQGEFTVSNVFAPGNYAIEVYKSGHIPYKGNLTLGATDQTTGIINLTSCSQNPPRNLSELHDIQEWYRVSLQWLTPTGMTPESYIAGYNVYRDKMLIAKLPEGTTTFKEVVSEGTYQYEVSAIWTTGCESSRTSLSVTKEADPWEATITEFPFYDGFESGQIQPYWREKFLNSSSTGLPWMTVEASFGNDLPPYDGRYFITLYDNNTANNCTRLITPKMDLSALSQPYLSFYHLMPRGITYNVDDMAIYYKNDQDSNWVLLNYWTSETKEWTKRTMSLPNPTDTYWIAFEGNTFFGYGVSLDEIKVYDKLGEDILDVEQTDAITVYPNPAKTHVSIQGEDIQNLKVYDLMGNLIESVQLDNRNENHSHSLENYKEGVYMFRFENSNGGSVVKRVIVKK